MFTKGMRVQHKDVTNSHLNYLDVSGRVGTVMAYPVAASDPRVPEIIQGVHVRFDEPLYHKRFGAHRDWACIPEDLIPLDETEGAAQ